MIYKMFLWVLVKKYDKVDISLTKYQLSNNFHANKYQ